MYLNGRNFMWILILFLTFVVGLLVQIFHKNETGFEYTVWSTNFIRNWQNSASSSNWSQAAPGQHRIINSSNTNISLESWIQMRNYSHINCAPLFDKTSNVSRIEAKKMAEMYPIELIHDNSFIEITKNCAEFKRRRGYVTEVTRDGDFPIAYIILFYKELEQLEFLLRAIYRPQNVYCLHLDKFHEKKLLNATLSLVKCFDNVFIASKLENIVYAGFSRLQADINCMQDLVKSKVKWKYLINQASQAFPLRTNEELVEIFKVFNGSSNIAGRKPRTRGRYKTIWREVPNIDPEKKPRLNDTKIKYIPPPDNVTVIKGLTYGAFSREFVEFILTDEKAQRLLEWTRYNYSPDEHFWTTVNSLYENPQLKTPGGYLGKSETNLGLGILVKWKNACINGKVVHGICILGIDHLPMLNSSNRLFANKFYFNFEYPALHCLNELLQNRTRKGTGEFDLSSYKRLKHVRNHRPVS